MGDDTCDDATLRNQSQEGRVCFLMCYTCRAPEQRMGRVKRVLPMFVVEKKMDEALQSEKERKNPVNCILYMLEWINWALVLFDCHTCAASPISL